VLALSSVTNTVCEYILRVFLFSAVLTVNQTTVQTFLERPGMANYGNQRLVFHGRAFAFWETLWVLEAHPQCGILFVVLLSLCPLFIPFAL